MSYQIFYNGMLAGRKITRAGAQARAFQLIKGKGWDANKVEVRESKGVTTNA